MGKNGVPFTVWYCVLGTSYAGQSSCGLKMRFYEHNILLFENEQIPSRRKSRLSISGWTAPLPCLIEFDGEYSREIETK